MIVTEKYMLGREGLANKMIFQQRLKRNEGVYHGGSWGKKLIILESWSTKSGQCTSSINISRELVRNAQSQAPVQVY